MSTELSVNERRYESLVTKICEHYTNIEAQNLRRYHKLGEFVNEFLDGCERSKYGTATMEKLAQDLHARGPLGDIQDPLRFLYWAKNIRDAYPEIAKLDELATLGFRVNHAKMLYSLAPEIRAEVEAAMFQDGKVISTRQLDQLIKDTAAVRINASAQTAAAEMRRQRENPEPAQTDTEVVVEGAPDATTEAIRDADIPATVPRTGSPPRERTVSNPLKVLSSFEKSLLKANAAVPQTFIVLRETAQVGFDSDAAHTRYRDQLTSLKASARSLIEPLTELLASIESEMAAAVVPAPDTAAD